MMCALLFESVDHELKNYIVWSLKLLQQCCLRKFLSNTERQNWFQSIMKSLYYVLIQGPNVLEKLDAWKQRSSVPDGLLTDII